jgi:hypothetical protein
LETEELGLPEIELETEELGLPEIELETEELGDELDEELGLPDIELETEELGDELGLPPSAAYSWIIKGLPPSQYTVGVSPELKILTGLPFKYLISPTAISLYSQAGLRTLYHQRRRTRRKV